MKILLIRFNMMPYTERFDDFEILTLRFTILRNCPIAKSNHLQQVKVETILMSLQNINGENYACRWKSRVIRGLNEISGDLCSTDKHVMTSLCSVHCISFHVCNIFFFFKRELLHRLKRKGKLTNTALENLLGPFVETLDLEGALLSQKAPKIIVRQSPHLTALNLKDCGYIITDQVLIYLIKVSNAIPRFYLCVKPSCISHIKQF